MIDYIGNARIISALSDLPKIGQKHKYNNARVISVEAYQDDENENYLFYRVIYGESFNRKNIKYFDLNIDCFQFSYAIEKKNIFKRRTSNENFVYVKMESRNRDSL